MFEVGGYYSVACRLLTPCLRSFLSCCHSGLKEKPKVAVPPLWAVSNCHCGHPVNSHSVAIAAGTPSGLLRHSVRDIPGPGPTCCFSPRSRKQGRRCPVLSTFRDLTCKHMDAVDWQSHWQTRSKSPCAPGFSVTFIFIYCPFSFLHRDPGTMPRSPTSSEDEMAQSFSDYSVGSESDSSKEETIYDTIRATTEKPGGVKMEDLQGNTLVIRVVIQDLQQTVS